MAKSSNCTRDVGPLSLRASVAPDTLNEEKRTVDVIWTTGARVLRGFFDQFWEELSLDPKHVRMDRLNGGAPLLDAHNGSELGGVIGVVEKARLEKTLGIATVRFARAEDDPNADAIFRKVKDGIIRNVSVGYRINKMEKVSEEEGKIPVFRAVDWTPHEISMVPIGADAGAGVRSESAETNRCVFVTRMEKAMPNEDENEIKTEDPKLSPAIVATRAASTERIKIATERAAAEQVAREEARAEERIRASAITDLGKRWSMGDAWTSNMIAMGATVEECRTAILDVGAAGAGAFMPGENTRIKAGEDARDKFIRGGVACILERCGHTDIIARAKKVERLARNFKDVSLDPGEFRGMKMVALARHALEYRGKRLPHGLNDDEIIKRALQTRGDAGFNTTSDFAILLETAVNKIFVGQYAIAPVTWPQWAGRKSVQDFRASTFYRPGTFGVLDSVTEAGEIKHKNIPDGEKRQLTPATKANIIGITRRAMVNDDLGAFTSLASGLGLTAAFTVEADAFGLVTANSGLGINYDANPLFHSSRSNIGPTGATSITVLDGARVVMMKQKDPSANQYLALSPSVWIGPAELMSLIKQFNTSTADPTDAKNSGVRNRVEGIFPGGVIGSPYLSASSATRSYLLADPGLYPVFAVGFIDGQEAPRIESEQSFNYDGLQMRVILDYGVAVLDYRGAVTIAGA